MWVKDYLRKRETFGCYIANVRLSESQSDLANNLRIDIEIFDELFSLVDTQISKKSLQRMTSYYFRSQIKLISQHT